MTARAIFLDKDGTLIEDEPYNVDPAMIRLAPHAGPALRSLSKQGYALFVITNQAGVANGFFSESALGLVEAKIRSLLAEHEVELQGFYYCPHHPDGKVSPYAVQCNCRKPMPGLLHRAADGHGVDLSQSWMIGDILHDVEAGRRAGCRTVLIDNGNETEWRLSILRLPHLVAPDLGVAAKVISQVDGVP